MKKVFYVRENCPTAPNGYNKGECVEWRIGYELTGTPSERNNRPATAGGDVGEWQVKSPKASLTNNDNCKGYIFGFVDTDYYYEMTLEDFENFVNEFSYVDRDTKTKKEKIRLYDKSKKMVEWLESHSA